MKKLKKIKIKRRELTATFYQHSNLVGSPNGNTLCSGCHFDYGVDPLARQVIDHQIEMMYPKGYRLYLKKK